MKFAIITSKKDLAGLNIKDCLAEIGIKAIEKEQDSINLNNIDEEKIADLFIFATKHKSAAKINSLSVHVPGNWGKAELGGRDNQLCIASALYLREAFLLLNKYGKNLNYDIINEVTHHGPFLANKPCFFIEIGISEEQWQDKKAGQVIAKVLADLLDKEPEKVEVAIGLGGLHNCPSFNKVILENKIALSHICPKYNLHNLNKEMLQQAISRTLEKVDFVLLDWKGLGTEKQRILDLLKELNLDYKRTKEC